MMYRITFLFVCVSFLTIGATLSSETLLKNVASLRINTANALSTLAADTWKDDISGGECSGSKADAADCSNKYITKYIFPGIPAEVISCKMHPSVVQQYCAGQTQQQCQALIDSLVETLTKAEGDAEVDSLCEDGSNYGYRGNVACFEAVVARSDNTQQAAVLSAISGGWDCCKEGSTKCTNKLSAIQGIQAASLTLESSKSGSITVDNSNSNVGGGLVMGADAGFSEKSGAITANNQPVINTEAVTKSGVVTATNQSSSVVVTKSGIVQANNQPVIANTEGIVRSGTVVANNQPVVAWSSGVRTPNTVDVIGTGSSERGVQTQNNDIAQNSSRDLVDAFIGTGGLLGRFTNFVTGSQVPPRATPPGAIGTIPTTQVVYVTPEFTAPEFDTQPIQNIQAIAREVSATVPQTLTRAEQFAETLTRVGGPNEINTENKAYGRIQDLIIEDEAIRSLETAQEEAVRAKNSIFCDVAEQSDTCQARREARAREVERQVFIQELTRRELPESAVAHFLAVYDGWIEPSPAPATHATSTLSLVNAQQVLVKTAATVGEYIQKTAEVIAGVVQTVTNSFRGIIKEEVSIFNGEPTRMLALAAASQEGGVPLDITYKRCEAANNIDDEYIKSNQHILNQLVTVVTDGTPKGYFWGCIVHKSEVEVIWVKEDGNGAVGTCPLLIGDNNAGATKTCPTAALAFGSTVLGNQTKLLCWNEVDLGNDTCQAYAKGLVDRYGLPTDKGGAETVEAFRRMGYDITSIDRDGEFIKSLEESAGVTFDDNSESAINFGAVYTEASMSVMTEEYGVETIEDLNALRDGFAQNPKEAEQFMARVMDKIGVERIYDEDTTLFERYATEEWQTPTFPSKNTGYRVDPTFSQYESLDFSRATVNNGNTVYVPNTAMGKGSSLTNFISGSETTFTGGGVAQSEMVMISDGSRYIQSEPKSFVSRAFSGARDTLSNIGSAIGKLFSF